MQLYLSKLFFDFVYFDLVPDLTPEEYAGIDKAMNEVPSGSSGHGKKLYIALMELRRRRKGTPECIFIRNNI